MEKNAVSPACGCPCKGGNTPEEKRPETPESQNHTYGPEPVELADDDPRKGTMSDPNLVDRAWVNRHFDFNLKK